MKILVVSDSFKGTLSSSEIGSLVQEILEPRHQVDYLAVSDGGEGFIEAMQEGNRGELRTLNCNDPLGRTILAGYLIITGEGKLDMQTRSGKVPMGILKLGQQCDKPVICLCGVNELSKNPGFSAIHAVVPRFATLDESISNPRLTLLTLLNSVNF